MNERGDTSPVPWALRRGMSTVVTTGAIVAALGVVFAIWLTRGSDVEPKYPAGLHSVVPVPGAQVPRQSPIGAQLDSGWAPTLTIGAVRIPEAELDAGTTQLGQYYFSPGPGKAIEDVGSGTTCARITATPIIDVEAPNLEFEWCFNTF